MTADISRQVLRLPRHPAVQEQGVPVTVTTQSTPPTSARLLDLSRHGFRLRCPLGLALGEELRLELRREQCGLDLALRGSIRWRQGEASGAFVLGCESAQPLDWETLGELFLHRVLSTETRRAASETP